MDILIDKLKACAYRLAGQYFGCIVYGDDILLLFHSVGAACNMLKTCEKLATDFDVKFNSNKSVFMSLGHRHL